jgi:hypothetical protein
MLTVDLHIHTDRDLAGRDSWHGDKPRRVAKGIIASGINGYAITEHNEPCVPRFLEVRAFIDQRNENRRKEGKSIREIQGLLGAEFTVFFERFPFHIGYIFENEYNTQNAPPPLGRLETMEKLIEYQREYPGIVILNHPFWKSFDQRNGNGKGGYPMETVLELVRHDAIHAVEILNGCMLLLDKKGTLATTNAIELQRRIHNEGIQKALIGASDAHNSKHIGIATTRFDGQSASDLFSAIRESRTQILAIRPRKLRETFKSL